jgi:hypothetical protein
MEPRKPNRFAYTKSPEQLALEASSIPNLTPEGAQHLMLLARGANLRPFNDVLMTNPHRCKEAFKALMLQPYTTVWLSCPDKTILHGLQVEPTNRLDRRTCLACREVDALSAFTKANKKLNLVFLLADTQHVPDLLMWAYDLLIGGGVVVATALTDKIERACSEPGELREIMSTTLGEIVPIPSEGVTLLQRSRKFSFIRLTKQGFE